MSELSKRELGKPIEAEQAGIRIDAFLSKHFLFFTRQLGKKRSVPRWFS